MTKQEALFKTIVLLQHLTQLQSTESIDLFYIDLFCGAGGTSSGVELATLNGKKVAKVIACVNHDKNAIASHMANHPYALHFTEDMRILDLIPIVSLVKKIRFNNPAAKIVLWASLECTNFSKAKGGRSRDADSRTLANYLFRYINEIEPDLIQIENVEEFMSWGDLDENGKPISKDKGRLYLRWIDRVQYGYLPRHGCGQERHDELFDTFRKGNLLDKIYNFDYRILNAANYGAYTSRKRFFCQFAKKDMPIAWPEPTHSKDGSSGLFKQLHKWKAVKDVLDFNNEGTSIFGRKKEPVEATKTRLYSGLIKFVAGGKEAFMIKYNSMNRSGKYQAPDIEAPSPTVSCQNRLGITKVSFMSKQFSGHPESKNVSLEHPAGTITCIDHHAIINTNFLAAYYGNGDNVSKVDRPCPTVPTKDRFNFVQPKFLSPSFIDQQFGQSAAASIDKPLGCVTVNPKYSLITPWLMNTNFANVGSSVEEPSQVITANRKWHYLVNPQYNSAGGDINKPCFTLIARMDKAPVYLTECTTDLKDIPSFIRIDGNVITYEIYDSDSPMTVKIKEFMALYGILDIKMRMLTIKELKLIMGFPENYKLIGTQAEQKKYIGNAVEVNMARVLCVALAKVTKNRKAA